MNKNTSDSVTVRELYTLIDDRMGQVNASILRLEGKVDSLENGRLANVERAVSTIQGKLMMVPLLVSIAMGLFSFIVNYTFFKR